jgi:rRNA maturation protein Rpf1
VNQVLIKTKRVLLTTSRRPTSTVRAFCKDILCTLPNIIRVNRGKLSLEGVAEKALALDAENVVIVDGWRGGLGKIRFFQILREGLTAVPPTIYVQGVRLRRDFGDTRIKNRRIKSVAIAASPSGNSEVKRLETVFSSFFGVPIISPNKQSSTDFEAVMQFSKNADGATVTFKLLQDLTEIGPRVKVSMIWKQNS